MPFDFYNAVVARYVFSRFEGCIKRRNSERYARNLQLCQRSVLIFETYRGVNVAAFALNGCYRAQAVGCNIESYISFFGNLLFGLRTCAVLINKDRTGFCINSDIVAVRIVGVDDNAVCFFAADAAAVQKGVCKHAGRNYGHNSKHNYCNTQTGRTAFSASAIASAVHVFKFIIGIIASAPLCSVIGARAGSVEIILNISRISALSALLLRALVPAFAAVVCIRIIEIIGIIFVIRV